MSEATEGPESMATAAFRALDAERWDEFVGWLDPEAVEEFRAGQLQLWKPHERRPLTADDILRHQPDMPPEAVEYYLKRLQSGDRDGAGIGASFEGVRSLDELERLSGPEMLVRRLTRLSPKAKLAAELESLTDDAGLAEVDLRDVLPRRRVIGAVPEGDSTAHIVYRLGLGPGEDDEPPGPALLATAHRTPEGWRLRLDDGFFGLEDWNVMAE
ncbi:MAG TPA: hypothetical protein VFZ18_15945, partial [Longimicrobiaceae bacterium]